MKYLKYFPTEAEYNAFIQSEDFILPNVSYAKDADTVYYHIVKSGTMYTVYLIEQSDISGITYNEVDLGLPSGLKWADRNVGSNTEDDYGCYFAWGDTVGYKFKGAQQLTPAELAVLMQSVLFPDPSSDDYIELTKDNIGDILTEQGFEGTDLTFMGIAIVKNRLYNWSNYFDTIDGGSTFNKYATDKLTVLQPENDAATINMGSNWRMPTNIEFEELINNTTAAFIDLDSNEFSQSEVQSGAIASLNFKGIKLTSKINSNSIFIPAAGYCIETMLSGMRSLDYMWSSSLRESSSQGAIFMHFNVDGNLGTYEGNRYNGFSVRGVKSNK